MLPALMPVQPAPDPRHYRPLSEAILQACPGRRAAIFFLMLMAIAGFLAMGLMVGVEIFGIIVMDPRDPSGAGMGFCCLIDPLILGLCLYQTHNRRRSWTLPACTFAATLCSLALISWNLLSDRLADLQTIAMILAFHSGAQILAAGALLALRRIPWTAGILEEQRQPRQTNPLDF